MKKINFLSKLREEGKISLVEPSEEIMLSYMEKSESNLVSAKILLENNKLEESVSLAYFSMYHLVTALFFKSGIKSENHSASIILLKELFGIDNSVISESKKERIDKQYYVSFKLSKEEVTLTIKQAEVFNSKIHDFISKLNISQIKEIRAKFEEITRE